jgi:hypothetical protein
MPGLTRSTITNKIKFLYGVEVWLEKTEGTYYWKDPMFLYDHNPEQDICTRFYDSCTYMTRLNDWSLARWIQEFDSVYKENIPEDERLLWKVK